jgi:hypothetical protein
MIRNNVALKLYGSHFECNIIFCDQSARSCGKSIDTVKSQQVQAHPDEIAIFLQHYTGTWGDRKAAMSYCSLRSVI